MTKQFMVSVKLIKTMIYVFRPSQWAKYIQTHTRTNKHTHTHTHTHTYIYINLASEIGQLFLEIK